VRIPRGIGGAFEARKAGHRMPMHDGDIASTTGLTVHEPDDGVSHFAH